MNMVAPMITAAAILPARRRRCGLLRDALAVARASCMVRSCSFTVVAFLSGGGGNRTRDNRLMRPGSYRCYTPLGGLP